MSINKYVHNFFFINICTEFFYRVVFAEERMILLTHCLVHLIPRNKNCIFFCLGLTVVDRFKRSSGSSGHFFFLISCSLISSSPSLQSCRQFCDCCSSSSETSSGHVAPHFGLALPWIYQKIASFTLNLIARNHFCSENVYSCIE